MKYRIKTYNLISMNKKIGYRNIKFRDSDYYNTYASCEEIVGSSYTNKLA